MKAAGFRQGKYNPCTYWHKGRKLRTLVHGDDFVTTGDRENVRWLKKKMEERFDIKTKVIGNQPGEAKEERILNRVIRVTRDGWEYEPDQRRAELIIKGLKLEDAKGVLTPCEEAQQWREEEDKQELVAAEMRDFRGIAARANYLAMDRADIQFATKEVCRGMARPTKGDWRKLKRLGRYLVANARVITRYPWQGKNAKIEGYTDSDWGGCQKTLRSTSGGAMMMGKHCIKTWSATQKSVTLSSGEAELVAAVKMSTEVIGLTQLLADWGIQAEGMVLTDSAAALGIVKRKGNGKQRHIRVGMLWIQEKEESGEVQYTKVKGELNPADLMTTGVLRKTLDTHRETLRQETRQGRAQAGLKL